MPSKILDRTSQISSAAAAGAKLLSQASNKPPEAACEVVASAVNLQANLRAKIKKIRETIAKIIETIGKIRYGILSLADVLGADILAAVTSAAKSMVGVLVDKASSYAAEVLERLFSTILSLLLSFPEAIFSLVSIPLEFAIDMNEKERQKVNEAEGYLKSAILILRKWANAVDDTRYYRKMKTALPYIEKAMTLMNQMLFELGQIDEGVEERNAEFNQNKYRALRAALSNAIQETQPDSFLDNQIGLSKSISDQYEKKRKEGLAEIEAKYANRKILLDYEREQAYSNIDLNKSEDFLAASKLDLEWSNKVKRLRSQQKAEEIELEAEIIKQTQIDKSALIKSAYGLAAEFSNDMDELANNLINFLDNAKDAYNFYQRSQTATNTVYNIRSLIKGIIGFLIELLRKSGNVSAEIAIKAFEVAEASTEAVYDKFSERIEEFEETNRKIGAANMSMTLNAGHVLLSSADSVLSSTITESLIGLINADDNFEADSERFNNFINRISRIPDWDDRENVWAVTPGSSALSPYVQLIADAVEMVGKVPFLITSSNLAAKNRAKSILNQSSITFSKIKRHNTVVNNVLTSYTPFQSQEVAKIKKLLDSLGYLEYFSTFMDLKALAQNIVAIDFPDGLSEAIPTKNNCFKHYPNLFNELAATQIKQDNFDKPALQVDETVNKKNEDNEETIVDQKASLENKVKVSDSAPGDGFNNDRTEEGVFLQNENLDQ